MPVSTPPVTPKGADFGRRPCDYSSRHKPKIPFPRFASAVLEALQFANANPAELAHLSDTEWNDLLAFCDSAQVTLILGHYCSDFLPEWVQARIYQNHVDNGQRFEILKTRILEIAAALSSRSIDFTLLKGFSHSPLLTPNPLLRAQTDIDIWCLPHQVLEARDVLVSLGYRPIERAVNRHLDPMVRETHWTWTGNYFAPDLPLPVDLHFQLWDEEMEQIPGPKENEVWARRSRISLVNRCISVLAPEDTVAFAALHLMMHLLHGDLRLQRAWEIGRVLQTRRENDDFWSRWRSFYNPDARTLQIVAFLLADHWFACGLPEVIRSEVAALPPDISVWIRHYGFSPLEALFVPNKNELWLNLCLLKSLRSKTSVFCRRLFPFHTALATINKPSAGNRPFTRLEIAFWMKRAWHHGRTMLPTCIQALKWWWQRQQFGRDFLAFLLVSVLFDLGEFIFFLLYNLYLLDIGQTEAVLGQVSAAVTAGNICGLIPAAEFTRRFGLQKLVLVAIVGTVCSTIVRAIVHWTPALLITAFFNGWFLSFWAVSLPPAIAGLTTPRNRTFGFSLISSAGIGMGTVAGLLGGRLPEWLIHFTPSIGVAKSKQIGLLIGSALVGLAILPGALLKFPRLHTSETRKSYPRGPFIYSFLAVLFVWSFGTGGFNPFFNAYFSRKLHMAVEDIGNIFSYAQLAQVFAVLLAPALLKMIGEIRGIASMQAITAVMLCLLASLTNPWLAAFSYVGYMCFQYMSEPCLLSMLMSHVATAEQGGASAMNFMTVSLASMFAAVAAGAMFSHWGYSVTLTACAIITLIGALLFALLVRPQPRIQSATVDQ